MTVAEEIAWKGEEKKSVVVGIRMHRNDRELLNWALVKVAEPGDRVVAVHVCRDSDTPSIDNPSLDAYLEVYEGLCNVKQIDLMGQISRGTSVRKVLVKEAKHFAAVAVVVGISKHNALGGWISMAKYCAKQLPENIKVVAVNNGKVVFERSSNNQLPGVKGDPKPCFYPTKNPSPKENKREVGDEVASIIKRPSAKADQKSQKGSRQDPKVDSFSLVHACKEEVIPSLNFPLKREVQESRLGWPLLRRAGSVISDSFKDPRYKKMSVVQWVMNLPNRPALPSTPIQLSLGFHKTENPFEGTINSCGDQSNEDCLSAWEKLIKELKLHLETNSPSCRWFSRTDVERFTSQFSSENLIGFGGYSHVYKGYLPNGKPVAVKVLRSSKEAWEDFILEIDIICALKHKHIVPLIGICVEDSDLITVFDFLSRGSLEENLHGKKHKSKLSWKVRFNAAVGVAEALTYVHNYSRPVIHRDVKSSNILLSNDFEPQLSDFGLAIWAPTTSLTVTHSKVEGTFGYLAPEYFMHGKVSDKVDVYAFGVVLLELLSGKESIATDTPRGQESLVMWAKPILDSGDLKGILDPELGEFDEDQARRMVMAASLCISRAARIRPQMNQILNLLRGEIEKDVKECMNSDVDVPKESDNDDDDEIYLESIVGSHLGLALLDLDDDYTSLGNEEQNNQHTSDKYL